VDGRDPAVILRAGALAERTALAAANLADRGVGPGHRVLWSCAASMDSIVGLLGALRLGAVLVPVNPSSTQSELAYLQRDARPSAALVDRPATRECLEEVDPGCAVSSPADLLVPRRAGTRTGVDLNAALPGDDALIVYTSGTTGEPKGAVHTHRSLLAGVQALRIAWDWQPDDRLILALPLFHVHGLCAGLFGALASGGTAAVFDRFEPALVLEAAGAASLFFGVPTMYHRLAETGRAAALADLRLCVAGSAPLPADLWWRFAREFGVSVLERYGMSETLLTLSNPLVGERRPGSVGLPLPGVEAMVAAPDDDGVGELMVRGPSLCRGYWERSEASEAMGVDGWFATFSRGISSMATMKNNSPVPVMSSPCSRVWIAATMVRASTMTAGKTMPSSASDARIMVRERMAMMRMTMAEERKMAALSGMNSCAKYISGYAPVNVPRIRSSIQRSKLRM